MHKIETLLKDKISTKTNKQDQHRLYFQNKIQSNTGKNIKTQTKIKLPSTKNGSNYRVSLKQTTDRVSLEAKQSKKKKTYFPLLSNIFLAPKHMKIYSKSCIYLENIQK